MKNIVLFWLLLLGTTAQAAVLTLNNRNPSPGQYTTFAAAQDAASAGDTILVHGSSVSYGTVNISKSLTVIGPGHKPNLPTSLSANFVNIEFASNTSNIRLYGLFASNIGWDGTPRTNVDNVVIENCSFGGAFAFNNSSNWLIKNNVLSSVSLDGSNATGIVISNNYLGGAASACLFNFGGSGTKQVINNLITGIGDNYTGQGSMSNTTFENNIFYGRAPGLNSGSQTNCVYNNNLSYLTINNTLPTAGQSGSGNQVNVNPLLVNAPVPPAPQDFSYTRNYRLGIGSPGLGAGTGGTNLGVYESDHEFSMTGEPARPQTTTVTTPASVPLGGTISTSFTIRKATTNAQ